MPNGEVEKLTVSIEADVSDLLADTKKGVDRAERELQDLEKTGSKTFKTIGESAKRAFNIAIDGVKRFGASAKRVFQGAVNGAKRLTANFGGLKTAAVAFIAAFSVAKITGFFKESIELTKTQIAAEKQLETVLKSTGNAVGLTADELKKMASELQNVTNFGDEATIAAQAILLTFTSIGKEVFPGATKAILDVSTAMGQDLRTSAIQIGKALNDPIAGLGALRRVGIQFTDQQEEQIRTLTKSGQIVEAQTIILGELERQFGGSAEAARQADGGFIAFSNTIGDLQELLGLPVFEALADQFGRLNDALAQEQTAEAIAEIATAFGEAAAALVDFVAGGAVDFLSGFEPQPFLDLADSLASTFETASLLADIFPNLTLTNIVEDVTFLVDKLNEALLTAAQLASLIRAQAARAEAERAALEEAGIAAQLFGVAVLEEAEAAAVAAAGQSAFNEVIQESIASFDEFNQKQQERRQDTEEATDATVADTAALQQNADAMSDVNDQLLKRTQQVGTEFLDLQEQTNEQLEELNESHAEAVEEINEAHADRLADIAEQAAKARIDAQRKADNALQKLAQDTANKRGDIIERARLNLEKLEAETDRAIKEQRDSFNTDELRDTEDHLKAMRRLRQNFIDSLADVIKNRDARALVDLRRRFRREQETNEEDFTTRQQREREDQDLRLQQLRENEALRSEEILANQERDLQRLMEAEQQKRDEINRTLQEELTRIDEQEEAKVEKENENFEARLERENEQFTKQQEQLNKALEDRLESEAMALADQDEITEEGARAILETLDEVFGIGGDIDQLMEDFAARRREKFRITVEFEEQIGQPPTGPAPVGGPPQLTEGLIPSFQRGGSMIARRPTLAMFGEAGPEIASFMPISQMQQSATQRQEVDVNITMRGSAPPGIRSADRDQIAGVLVSALEEAGVRR